LQLGKAPNRQGYRLYIYGRFGTQARKARRAGPPDRDAARATELALALAPAGASGPALPDPGPLGRVRVGTGTGTALSGPPWYGPSVTDSK
jgi:hypothetical protein